MPWPSFDGDPTRLLALREALERLFAVFPQTPGTNLRDEYGDETDEEMAAIRAELSSVLRSHGQDRRAMPLALLQAKGMFSDFIPREAFGYFFPSFQEAWLEGTLPWSCERAWELRSDWQWSPEEERALTDFLVAALAATLATPFGSSSNARSILSKAAGYRIAIAPLLARFLEEKTPLAVDHLVDGILHYSSSNGLFDDPGFWSMLAAGFYGAEGERAERIEEAIEHLETNGASQRGRRKR